MSHRPTLTRFVLLLSAGLLAVPVSADPPGGKRSGGAVDNLTISAGITVGDARRLAAEYDLAGAKPLPPGIRKNLARGKPLPPGIVQTRMPAGFVESLPTHPDHEWRRAGTDLVLVVRGTWVVTDILRGVFD